VDLLHDEVIITDENNFGIMTYGRTENTPPTAKMSEPRRLIQGKSTMLEYNCSVYVDPATGDIYGVNNDTIDTLVIFNRDARGNAPPTRKLYTPHTTYGITVDEQAQEMFLTIQDDHAVVVYSKSAKEEEGPLRILQGSRTGLADPHGIAIDEEAGLLYVVNWGTTNERPAPGTVPGGGSFGRGNTRADWPIGRAKAFAASGKLLPASITVYAKSAKGDTAPVRTIHGPKTQMNWPTAIAVDPINKELFVANDTGDSVTVYSANASGDVAPIRTIQGPKSLVKNPTGLYYDKKHEELWVTNFGNHTAAVFKRTASGDTPPLRVIRSAPLDAPAPMMGNPHTIAYDTKRDEILVSN
jgi:DNA-binding beta-propeller fold protein YncE